MTKFLELVAQDLRHKGRSKNDFSNITVVFPSKRASLFFNEYLVQQHETVWAPQYTTIAELFASLSDKQEADTIESVFRLYDIYKSALGLENIESIDQFYGWGERILSDFDDIDKNMAAAEDVFRKTADLTAMKTRPEDLNEDYQEAVKLFFSRYVTAKKEEEGQRTKVQEKFSSLWHHLYEMYVQLNKDLAKEGKAYQGALYRDVVEHIKKGEVDMGGDHLYAFVGFNVLDKAEEYLFKSLQGKGKALFYWDYDLFYTDLDEKKSALNSRHEAGVFVAENVRRFGNRIGGEAFQQDWDKGKEIEVVECPGENAQVYSMSHFLKDTIHKEVKERETAVVLCNENMLEPILYAIPEGIEEVNITKGYPMAHTLAYKEVETYFQTLKVKGDTAHSLSFWMEKLKEIDDDIVGKVAQKKEAEEAEAGKESFITTHQRILNEESYFMAHTLVTRLSRTLEGLEKRKQGQDILLSTFRRLVLQLLRKQTIPLKGEPAQGLQIMGLLETRNLDFEHVILLSTNEGVLPQRESDNSFIPYPVRGYFNLTLPWKKTAVYAYYFYRLLQRAKKITLCYNGQDYDQSPFEPSRFILQLAEQLPGLLKYAGLGEKLVPKQLKPFKRVQLKSPLGLVTKNICGSEKQKEEWREAEKQKRAGKGKMGENKGENKVMARFYPTRINNYIDCPLKYLLTGYYDYEVPQEEGVYDQRRFGTYCHNIAELLVKELYGKGGKNKEGEGKMGNWESIKSAMAYLNEHEDRLFDAALEELNKGEKHPLQRDYIIDNIAKRFIVNLMKEDMKMKERNLVFKGAEMGKYMRLDVSDCLKGCPEYFGKVNDKVEIEVGGFIDRLDECEEKEGTGRYVRVVDYKTGLPKKEARNLEEVFDREMKKRPHYYFQTLLYSCAIANECTQQEVRPALLYFISAGKEDYDPELVFKDNKQTEPLRVKKDNELYNMFMQMLREKVIEPLLTNREFEANPGEDNAHCEWCPMNEFCAPEVNEELKEELNK